MACDTSPVTGAFSCDSTPVDFPPSSAPAATADHSAWDWAGLIGGLGVSILKAAPTQSSPRPVNNLGIPTSTNRPGTTPAPSQTTGIIIIGAILFLVVWLVRRSR